MAEITKDQIASVAISQRVDGKPSFMILLLRDGTVKRMGFRSFDSSETTVAAGNDPTFFERFMAELPEELLRSAGVFEGEGTEGDRVVCRIELGGGPEPVNFEATFHAGSSGLPRVMSGMVGLAEELTGEWYVSQLASSVAPESVPRMEGLTDAAADSLGARPELEPLPEPEREEEPAPETAVGSSAAPGAAVGAAGGAPVGMGAGAAPAGATSSGRPQASKKRLVFVVLLDLLIISAAYGWLVLLTGGDGLPIGAALFLLALTEFCLLQFLRRSPGYWLLGMRAEIGALPTVDPGTLARESLITHIVAYLLLGSGLESVAAWATYQDPIPYFGFGWGWWFAGLVSLLLGAAMVASAVLVFKTDVRGVWVGAGAIAVSFLSMWTARGNALNGWLRLEMMAQARAQGRPIDPSAADPVLGLIVPVLLGSVLLYALGLYLVWRRLDSPKASRPEPAAVPS